MSCYIVFVILGCIFGVIGCILLCQMDEKWKALFLFGQGSFIAILIGVYNALEISQSNIRLVDLLAVSLPVMFASAIVTFLLFGKSLDFKNDEDGKIKLRLVDLLIGRKETINEYYKNIQNDIELNRNTLLKKQEELAQKEKSIIEQEIFLKECKEKITNQVKDKTNISLPINRIIPIDNTSLKRLPEYVENLLEFSSQLQAFTNQFLRESTNSTDEVYRLKAYFLGLCQITSVYLFDSNRDIRTHVRYLSNNGMYESVIACHGYNPLYKPLTSIESDKWMIFEAGKLRRSLVKSLNRKCHRDSKNDHIWENYITMVFDKLYKDNKPYISIGISVKNSKKYNEYLYFLNYCKIENIIQEYLLKVNEKYDIIGTEFDYREVQ